MSNPISRMSAISKVLEDNFFYSENIILKQEQDRLKKEEESIASLQHVSGIVNASVLKELVSLQVRPEVLAAVCLVPIIQVAWADGIIEENEIKAVLKGAYKHGFSEDNAILKEWLNHRPDPQLFVVWKTYMQGFCEILSKESLESLKNEVYEHTRMVAAASGGFLGLINPISPSEQSVLDTLEAFFKEPGPCCN